MASPKDDLAQAIEARWNADAQLPVLVPGGIHQGRQVAAVTPNAPYCTFEIEQGPTPNALHAGGFYEDYRHVTFTIWGLKPAVLAAVSQIGVAFDWTILTIPNGTFARCKPLDDRELAEDPMTKSGESIWLASAQYEVMSTRAYQS